MTKIVGLAIGEDCMEQQVDVDKFSLEELKKLANEEAAKQPTEEPPAEEPKEDDEEPVVTIFRREVDLGDGSGVQVFEGKSVEELVDKLVSAQTNATKKIREQAQKLKEIEVKQHAADEQMSADEEFVYSQKLMSHPTQAMKEMFQKMTGYDISEFKTVADRAKAWEASQQQQAEQKQQEDASIAFVAAHPEYVPNPSNGARLSRAVNLLAAEARQNGQNLEYPTLLQKAYQDLSESGLLELKSADDATAAKDEATGARTRIEQREEVVQTPHPRKASTLAGRASVTTTPKTLEPTEEECDALPLATLRELANRQLRGK